MCHSHTEPPAHPRNAEQARNTHESLVAAPLPDGYWIQAFPFSTHSDFPDIIAYGLGFKGAPSTIRLFTNPRNAETEGVTDWGVAEIALLDFPVGMTFADLTGDGFNDVIITDRYGPSMDDLWDAKTQDGGRVLWLQNPGKRTAQPLWDMEKHKIGNSTGMHRLQAGHFTRRDVFEVMALPVIAKSSDLTSPAPVLIFTPTYGSDKSQGPVSWDESTAFGNEFRLIHDVKLLPGSNDGLDMVLVSGREGIVLLWFDLRQKSWVYNVVGEGMPQREGTHGYWGSESVDVCRVGDDDVGYIATAEAFHGNNVAVYTKSADAPKGTESLKLSKWWTRTVIDNYGPLDKEQGTGTVHHVSAVPLPRDSDRDGESFAIACMGAPVGKPQNQGVYLYRPIDLCKAEFEKIKITGESAGRLAVAAYARPGHVDIASLSYYVPGYHTGPDPSQLRINSFSGGTSSSGFSASKLDTEILLRIPRPSSVPAGEAPKLPFWSLAGKHLTIVVLSPNSSTQLDRDDVALKVIYGQVEISDKHTNTKEPRRVAPAPKTAATTTIPIAAHVVAGDHGAVFVAVKLAQDYQGPFHTMSEIHSENVLPRGPGIPQDVADLAIPYVKVDKLPWAQTGAKAGQWNDFEFYNAVGFHVYFNDDNMEKVVHIQAWTLGLGETARFHKHDDKSFCEIHYCLTNGGGTAGMRYFADDYNKDIDVDAELTKEYVEKNGKLIVVPDLHEHGALWKTQPNTEAKPELNDNDTVAYPFHGWLAGEFGEYTIPVKPPLDAQKQKYDVWMAFEFPPTSFQF